jgi:uncharacterized protein (UPF0335 family)
MFGLENLGISIDTLKPMLFKHMDKEKIVSILVTKKGDAIETKNYSINVLESIETIKKEYASQKEQLINLETLQAERGDLSQIIAGILKSRKADSSKLKEITKLVDLYL